MRDRRLWERGALNLKLTQILPAGNVCRPPDKKASVHSANLSQKMVGEGGNEWRMDRV